MGHVKVRAALLLAFFVCVACASGASASSWQELAKKVGESEENRDAVMAQLRHVPGLKKKLAHAIYTKDRPLALDVISSLGYKEFVGDLLLHVPADPDGFLTVAINSMMEPSNQKSILASYVENLSSGTSSYAADVAMLEPLGRLGMVLSRDVLVALSASPSPEVRSAVVYYLRMMALRNHHYENLDLLAALLKSGEFQVRLQVVSVSSEILAAAALAHRSVAGVPSFDQMKSVCGAEKTPSVRSACLGFVGLAPRAPASLAPQCSAMETKLYSRDTLKIRMVFGYKDARPARFVGDRHERLAYIERITSVCSGAEHLCGFERSHDNADLFLKKLDIKGRARRVLLWVVNSSVGTDDQENLNDPFQKWKSKYAEEAFTSGLHDTDVVLYDGHSRFGGGPDFASPRLSADGTVDPAPYLSSKPGLSRMLRALHPRTPSRLKILGLFSCSSSQHFSEQIHDVSHAGIVSSKVLMYYSDALEQSLGTVGDILAGRCPRGIAF